LAAFAHYPSVFTVAACAALVGIGFGLTTVPGLVALQESVAWNQRGMVTGLVTFFRSLGQVLGVAALGAVGKAMLGDAARDQDPLVVQSAIGVVFTLMLVFALIHLFGSFAMPRSVATTGAGGTPAAASRSAS
jgi:hypothetical protein